MQSRPKSSARTQKEPYATASGRDPRGEPAGDPLLRPRSLAELVDDAISAERAYAKVLARDPKSPDLLLVDDRRRVVAKRIWARTGFPRLFKRGPWAVAIGWSAESGRAVVQLQPIHDLDSDPLGETP
jgi:hypothetical protein